MYKFVALRTQELEYANDLVLKGRRMIEDAEFFDLSAKLRGLHYIRKGIEMDPSQGYSGLAFSYENMSMEVSSPEVSDQIFVLEQVKRRLRYFEDKKKGFDLYQELLDFCRDFFIEEVVLHGEKINIQDMRVFLVGEVDRLRDTLLSKVGELTGFYEIRKGMSHSYQFWIEMDETARCVDKLQKNSVILSDVPRFEHNQFVLQLEKFLRNTFMLDCDLCWNCLDDSPFLPKFLWGNRSDMIRKFRATYIKLLCQSFLLVKKCSLIDKSVLRGLKNQIAKDIVKLGRSADLAFSEIFFL